MKKKKIMIVMDCNAYKTNIHESILIQINNLNTLIRKKKGTAVACRRSPFDE